MVNGHGCEDLTIICEVFEGFFLILREFYGLEWWAPEEGVGDDYQMYVERVITDLLAHILGGSVSAPNGKVYASLGYVASGANYHSQITGMGTLAAVASVESAIMLSEARPFMPGDVKRLGFMLPQSSELRILNMPLDMLKHAMEDQTSTMGYEPEDRKVVEAFVYDPTVASPVGEWESLPEGQQYLRGYEVPNENIKFLVMETYQLMASDFSKIALANPCPYLLPAACVACSIATTWKVQNNRGVWASLIDIIWR